MKKVLIVCLTIFLVLPSVFAARKKDKAGKIENDVFTDKKYNFQLTLPDTWKVKVKKNKDNYRMVLTQVDYAIPPDYNNAPDYTMIPRTVVFVGETKLSTAAFIDSMISNSYKSDIKKDIYKEFEILSPPVGSGFKAEKLVPRKRKSIQIGNVKGTRWTGRLKYTNEVAVSASSMGGKRVKGAYGGMIVAIKKDDTILLFHTISEWIYFENIAAEIFGVINTLKWE